MIDARSGTGRQIAERAELLVGWSRDGNKVYFNRFAGDATLETELVEHHVDSGTGRTVHRWRGGESVGLGIALSPDAMTLYYRSPGSPAAPAHRLIAKDVATGKERTLVQGRPLGSITISSAGRFVVSSSDGTLLLVPTNAGAPRPVPSVSGEVPTILVWAPDGRSFLGRVTTTADNGEVRATYWWVPLGDPQAPRKIDWNVGPAAYGFTASRNWIAFSERIAPAAGLTGAGVIESASRR